MRCGLGWLIGVAVVGFGSVAAFAGDDLEIDPPTIAPATRPTVETPATKTSFHIYLLMGQSNMDGRDRKPLDAQVDHPRVLALSDDGRWTVARDPLRSSSKKGGIGLGITFATEMLKTDPNVTIGLVPCAVGGTGLSKWVRTGELYHAAVKRAKLATGAGVIKGVLWHQGESDAGIQKTAESYESRLTQMFADLRKDLGDPNLPIVVGQLGDFLRPEKIPHADTVRAALKQIPDTVPNVGFADSAGLKDLGDRLHFDAESTRVIGTRYAEAMKALQTKASTAKSNTGAP